METTNAKVEADEPIKLHPTAMLYIYKVVSTFICDVSVETTNAKVEADEPIKLHPTAMLYIYKVVSTF